MKIAVIGSGGVGGYFGGRLAAAGNDVTFVARGAHLDAMQKKGLRVLSALGDINLEKVQCTDDTNTIGPVDIVMIAVKLWSTDEAVAAAKPLVGPDTTVVSFQNGIIAEEKLLAVYGREHTIGGVANIAALIEQPGVIRHNGTMASLIFAELDGKPSKRTEVFYNACVDAGIKTELANDIHTRIWEKFVRLVTLSSMTSLCRMPVGPIREDPDTRALLQQVMTEVINVAKAKGANLVNDIIEKQMAIVDGYPPTMVASMCGDLRRGNRLELPWLAGMVAKLGKELDIPTPANQFVYAALKLYTNGRPELAQI
ncbi:MAG: 2-dehydropantoate 2-reductase [Betaproteobacteria bacterium]|nr:MAG: 2-dehydropantoate 2-reductase [Betaproteobacteria bacterium]